MAYPDKQKEFVKWLYSEKKNPPTANELAEQLRVSYVTLSRWKQDISLHWRWLPAANKEQPGTIARYQAKLNNPANLRFQIRVMAAGLRDEIAFRKRPF